MMRRRSKQRHLTFTVVSLLAVITILLVTGCASVQRSTTETVTDETEKQMFLLTISASYYENKGQYVEAVRTYEQVIQLKPGPSDVYSSKARRWAQNNLAWLLATCRDDSVRDGARAITFAEQVLATYPNDVAYLDTLAAAYAEAGRFEDAERTAQAAENHIPEKVPRNNPQVVKYKKHFDMYRSHRPWREP